MTPSPNTMPMAAAAQSVSAPIFPPSKTPPIGSGKPPVMPPSMPMPVPSDPPVSYGHPGMPPPTAPAAPPYQVSLQPDGSSKYSIQTPQGEVVLGINPPPKLPKAFQAATPPAQ